MRRTNAMLLDKILDYTDKQAMERLGDTNSIHYIDPIETIPLPEFMETEIQNFGVEKTLYLFIKMHELPIRDIPDCAVRQLFLLRKIIRMCEKTYTIN